MNRSMNQRRIWKAVAVAVLASCTTAAVANADKTGSETVVLHLAMIDGGIRYGGPGAESFVDALAEVSDGRIQVELTESYHDGDADAESRLIEAIAAGDIDGGWPSTRAFANAGIRGLEAIEAPMLIASFDAQRELVTSPAAELALEQLNGSGVVGLGLAVLDLRRPFAVDAPLLEPANWQGIRFRSYHSPVQADTISALGGEPVDLSFSWVDEVNAGRLDGAESGVLGGTPPGVSGALYITSNVVLWPKVGVLSLSQARFDDLDDEQRDWVQQAADLATQASVDATYDEDAIATAFCERGVRIVSATAEQLTSLRDAVAPVIDALGADPETAPLLAEVRAIAERHPDPDVLDVPPGCAEPADANSPDASIPIEPSALPDGTYRTEISLADVEAAGLDNGPGWTGMWTLQVSDGTYALSCRLLDLPSKDCGNSGLPEATYAAGLLRGSGNRVTLVFEAEALAEHVGCALPISEEPPCIETPPVTMTWALDGDELTFSDASGEVEAAFVLQPWQKID
jgi:TRAP-type C4-dicarboxylate transport system substrate-binding protein